jgi:hypothetical protein
MRIVTLAYHQTLNGELERSTFFTILTNHKFDGLAIRL